jgi:hypothetical protein
MSRAKTKNLRWLAKRLRSLEGSRGREVAVLAAREIAPAVSSLARSEFDGGSDVYGSARRLGKHGNKLSLRKSGAAYDSLTFAAFGTRIRSQLAADHVKYIIGKYVILPRGNERMPDSWLSAIARIMIATTTRYLRAV